MTNVVNFLILYLFKMLLLFTPNFYSTFSLTSLRSHPLTNQLYGLVIYYCKNTFAQLRWGISNE